MILQKIGDLLLTPHKLPAQTATLNPPIGFAERIGQQLFGHSLRGLNEENSRQKYMYSVNTGVGQTHECNTCVEMILLLWFFLPPWLNLFKRLVLI